MLSIATTTGPPTFGWHVGEPTPDINNMYVSWIQADGDELDRIYSIFCPLAIGPTITWARSQKVHRWYGSEAKTILWGLFNA